MEIVIMGDYLHVRARERITMIGPWPAAFEIPGYFPVTRFDSRLSALEIPGLGEPGISVVSI